MERIRFSSNQNIGEGESNFDDWKCPTQQSFIPQEINSLKIHILGRYSFDFFSDNLAEHTAAQITQPLVLVVAVPILFCRNGESWEFSWTYLTVQAVSLRVIV